MAERQEAFLGTAVAVAGLIATLAPLVQQALARGSDITDAELDAAAAGSGVDLAAWKDAYNAAKGGG